MLVALKRNKLNKSRPLSLRVSLTFGKFSSYILSNFVYFRNRCSQPESAPL